MEMSLDYLRETVDFFRARGFEVDSEEERVERDGVEVHTTHRSILCREPREHFALSCVRYPDGVETYWLEIRDFHGLRAFDTELDSWRHGDDQVEFKYYAREDGVALAFTLELPPP